MQASSPRASAPSHRIEEAEAPFQENARINQRFTATFNKATTHCTADRINCLSAPVSTSSRNACTLRRRGNRQSQRSACALSW